MGASQNEVLKKAPDNAPKLSDYQQSEAFTGHQRMPLKYQNSAENQPLAHIRAQDFGAISGLLTAKKSVAALAHYPTLRIQTNNLHNVLREAILAGNGVVNEWMAKLADDNAVASEFMPPTKPLFPYRTIAPALVRNLHLTADFLLEEAHSTPPVDTNRVGDTTPTFRDFVRLAAAVRGFLDALVQTAYQLANFDGKQLNYKFLQSLLSFATVAPPSLHANIVSSEMQDALDAFVALAAKDRKNSAFTKAAHDQFPQRLQIACQPSGLPDWRRRNLELLFRFCSDFVHSGYVSVLAIGDTGSSVILGGPDDAFTPKAENFAELKQRLLAECAGAYADLLLPVLGHAIGRTLVGGMPTILESELNRSMQAIGDVRAVLHRQFVEPVRQSLIGSRAILSINCICGGKVNVLPPHHEWDRFCPTCGSRFSLHEVSDEVDYVISASGIGDVLGGDATKFAELDDAARAKLIRIADRNAPEAANGEVRFLLITDLLSCDEDTLEVPSQVMFAPCNDRRGECTVITFVAAKSLKRCALIRIQCNCGAYVDYQTAEQTNLCQCSSCQTVIGLMGVTGDGDSIHVSNPDGTPGKAPIQARDRFAKLAINPK
jgi:hypothetical protein